MQFFQRDESLSFPALGRHRATPFIGQKIFQRLKQIRTKPPLLLPDSIQAFTLEQRCKKTLGKILRFLMAASLPPNECVKWPPVNAAKCFERLASRRRFTLRLQHHAPMRGGECHRTMLRISANGARGSHLISRHAPIQLKAHAEIKPVSGAAVRGESVIFARRKCPSRPPQVSR